MPDKYQYYITTRIGTRQVNPLGKLSFAYDKQNEDNRRGYVKTFNGKLTFVGADFNWLYALEQTIYRCETVSLSVWKFCAGEYVADWQTGTIAFNKADWDLDRCSVEVSLDIADKYACYESHKDEALNLLVDVTHNETVTLASGDIEYLHIVITNGVPDTMPNPPDPDKWTMYHNKIEYSEDGRVEHADYATYNLGGGIYQPALVYAPVLVYDSTMSETTWSIYTDVDAIDNGMRLQEVFEAFLSSFCSPITLVSDFFQWNPEDETDTNYVTGELSKVKNLILFQKSDVKRPNASGNATVAELTFEDLLKNICTIFNCRWDISDDGSVFRIEHYSFWDSSPGLDLTGGTYERFVKFKRKYSYQVDDMPKFEKFTFPESFGTDFIGTPIWYDSACVTTDESNKEKLYEVDKITTDVALCMSNPDADSKVVSDDGFVLMACYESNIIITEAGVLANEFRVNNSLAWAQLQRDYYMHGRVLLKGYMNRQLTDFLSCINTKLQEKISVPLCCGDTFDPVDLVTTPLQAGGQVSKAEFDLNTDMLTLDLLFNANDGLIENTPPVANNDEVTVYQNTPLDIDVLANDTDAESNIIPTTVEIVTAPDHGTAVVNPDGTITYTPDTDYIGGDLFQYRVFDYYGEPSNPAFVIITVDVFALAIDDTYTTFQDEAKDVPAPGALDNDLGTGLTVDSYDSASAQGGTVAMGTNGAFIYTPPSGYTGPDSFDYTITDGLGHFSTATVNIEVIVRHDVYVHLSQTVVSTEPIEYGTGCSGADPNSYEQESDIVVHYYSDAGGTTPLDITDYGLTIGLRRATVDNYPSPGAPTNYDTTFTTATGTSQALYTNLVTHRSFYDCHTGAYGGTDFSDTYSLLTGTGYTII